MSDENQNIFTIRIIYDNGYTIDFDCYEFFLDIVGDKKTAKWRAVPGGIMPVFMNLDKVMAVYQVAIKKG